MTAEVAERALTDLGFTDLEAAAYCALLRSGPTTAYQVARSIGKAAANTYQGLAALAQKGAVVADEGPRRIYRAVQPDDLLMALQRTFSDRRQTAAAALSELGRGDSDERLYQLQDLGQVMERARSIIGGAREILLFDMFPDVIAQLAPDLDAAASRGVTTVGLVYGPPPAIRATCLRSHSAAFVLRRWPGQQLTVVADAAAHLTGLLAPDARSVRRAFWSDSRYLACVQHSGLSSEIRLSVMTPQEDDPYRAISLLNAYPEGLKDLIGPREPQVEAVAAP